jgi:hypothetical protein
VEFNDEAMLQYEGEIVWCSTLNLSITGMAMTSPVPVPVDQPVLLGFSLDPAEEPESAQGVVVRSETSHQGCQIGIQFKGMDGDLFERLRRFVAGRRRDPAPVPA